MLRRTYKDDLQVRIVDNCLEVTCTFIDVYGRARDFGKRISIEKPLSAKILDDFFEDILQELAWIKVTNLTELANKHLEQE